jgi:membrane-bound lytic murein transglycosylase MltF
MTMSRRNLIAAMALTTLAAPRAWPQTPQAGLSPAPRALQTWFRGHTEDFDAMPTRRFIRIIVPYSPTLFFEDKGAVYGTAVNGAQLFENWLNKTFPLRAQPMTVSLNPVSRDKLFDALLAGDGDIAAGDITITEERRKKVAFSTPVRSDVREIVITGKDVPGAVGIMQIKPNTARGVGVGDISTADPNIHAGTKLLAVMDG